MSRGICKVFGIDVRVDKGVAVHGGSAGSICHGSKGKIISIIPAPPGMRVIHNGSYMNHSKEDDSPVICLALVEYCNGIRGVVGMYAPLVDGSIEICGDYEIPGLYYIEGFDYGEVDES